MKIHWHGIKIDVSTKTQFCSISSQVTSETGTSDEIEFQELEHMMYLLGTQAILVALHDPLNTTRSVPKYRTRTVY